ncbi:hypothetical protein LXL04_020646 [Taraxacum kok-saghyz]
MLSSKAKKIMMVTAISVLKGVWEARSNNIFKNVQMEKEVRGNVTLEVLELCPYIIAKRSSPENANPIRPFTDDLGDDELKKLMTGDAVKDYLVDENKKLKSRNCFLKSDYVSTVFDNFSANVVVNGATVNLGLWDTAGGLQQIKTTELSGADVFILAFSLISKASYENICKKWFLELKHYAPGVPIIIVGTKIDLRDDKQFFADHPNAVPITTAQKDGAKIGNVKSAGKHPLGFQYTDGINHSTQVDDVEFEENEVYAIDIVTSTGDGKPKLFDEKQTTIYKRAVDKSYHLKLKASRFIFSEINQKFPIMPFSARSRKRGKMGDNIPPPPPPNSNNFSLLSMLSREKLNGSNFLDWSQALRIALRYEDKEYLIDHDLPYLDEECTEEEKKVYDHDTESRKVACIMMASMTSELQKGFDNVGSFELIGQLREMFQQQARQERYGVVESLMKCKQSDGASVCTHVRKMKMYIDILINLGVKVPNELAIDMVLNSLNGSFKQFIVNYNMNNFEKTLMELHGMLQSAEASMGKTQVVNPAPVLAIREGVYKKKKVSHPKGKGKGNMVYPNKGKRGR